MLFRITLCMHVQSPHMSSAVTESTELIKSTDKKSHRNRDRLGGRIKKYQRYPNIDTNIVIYVCEFAGFLRICTVYVILRMSVNS